MSMAIQNWPRLVKQIYEHLKPGGYAEFIEYDLTWVSPDNTTPPDWVGKKANSGFITACKEAGQDPLPGPKVEGWVKDAGFVDVTHRKNPLPVGTWPADKNLKAVGAWNYLQVNEGLEAFLMAIFTRRLGYSKEEVDVMCASIRREMKDPKMHTMYHLHIITGRKPGGKEEDEHEPAPMAATKT